MKRITGRTWLVTVFLAVLLGGFGLFLMEYAGKAGTWIASTGSPYLYSGGNLGCGLVTDRMGLVLLDTQDKRTYSDDAQTRIATLHWLGDRKGFISAGAVANYAAAMSGYDGVNGLYDYSGTGGAQVMTISSGVQKAAYKALAGRKGTVAVYNYKTGEILCAVSSPSYDPDDVPDFGAFTDGRYDGVYVNRFLKGAYTPGSIFKVVTTAAALETVPDILERSFTCTGRYSYGEEAVTCERAHGTLNLKWAVANSCNCCFAQIAELVGRSNMTEAVKRYQVTQALSFDGVTTITGNYDNSETGAASFAWSCIGQHTDLVNPARYMTFLGAIANGGSSAEPYIVSRVYSGGNEVYHAQTRQTGRLMSEEIAQILQEYLRNNVVSVYGSNHFPAGMTVCAKSGTSQLGGDLRSNAMFAGFVTDEAYPLAFFIAVENGGYGSAAGVPILSAVLAECKAVLDAE